MIDDEELARRSMQGCGEMYAAFGRGIAGAEAEVRRPNALGARIDAEAFNPFFSSAVVPVGETPPGDDPALPFYVWTVETAVPGRVEQPEAATPVMGLVLADFASTGDGTLEIGEPSLGVLGEMNERAYGETGFSPLARALRDERFRVYGVRDGGEFVCVAMTVTVGDDLGIYYVATEESHRRRGLASRLVGALLADARDRGLRTSTLQASADGRRVWMGLGYRRVATMRGYVRPDVAPSHPDS